MLATGKAPVVRCLMALIRGWLKKSRGKKRPCSRAEEIEGGATNKAQNRIICV
jgi:hypothetical protein